MIPIWRQIGGIFFDPPIRMKGLDPAWSVNGESWIVILIPSEWWLVPQPI